MRLHAVDETAARLGLARGMMLTDAKARLPGLLHAPADMEGDRTALQGLAEWCLRYSPFVAADGEDGLLIDATGCAHLFGGEEAMLARMESQFAKLGLKAYLGMAQTVGAASALARFGPPRAIAPQGGVSEALSALPMAALRLEPQVLLLLQRLGLTKIGQLYAMPRLALARRFRSRVAEEAVLFRLDQALGRQPESLNPLHPAPSFRAHAGYSEPVQDLSFLPEVLRRLSADLKSMLVREGQGGTRWTFRALRVDGQVAALSLRTAQPVREEAHLARLFKERFEQMDLGLGAEYFILSADEAVPFTQSQGSWAESEEGGSASGQDEALAGLIDRLSVRLGAEALRLQGPCDSHVPERAVHSRPALEGAAMKEAAWSSSPSLPSAPLRSPPPRPLRPLRLLTKPEPIEVMAEVPDGPPMHFRWRHVPHQVTRAEGPERIAPEWWRLQDGIFEEVRDYFRIEDVRGRRYWVFRAGLYQDRAQARAQDRTFPGGAPSWFLHGFFA